MNSGIESKGSLRSAALAAAIAVGVAAGAAGYWLGTRSAAPSGATTASPAPIASDATKTDASGRKVLYWHDPMVPGQKFDKPGKSPFMDMDLVPVYADAAADDGKVTISPRLTQSFGVRTVEAKQGSLETGFTAVGTIAADERSIVAVQARSQGYIEKLRVRAQYDSVAAGQPLADLYVPEWLAAEEELLALKASTQSGAAQLAAAARQRLSLLGVPEAEIARVEREGKPSPRVTLTAPESGIVWEIGARDGMAVMPGTTIYRIAGLGTVWVIADVPEAQAALLATGTPVEVRAAAFPERAFKGTVSTLLPEVNAQTRTVRARIVVANPGAALKPGMFANVAFRGPALSRLVLLPSEAVIRTGKRDVVVVADAEGRFAPVEVEVGRESGDVTEIRKGVEAGQRIVASGQFLVDSEANLKGALERIAASSEVVAQAGGTDPHAGHKMPAATTAPPPAQVHKAEGVVRSVGDEVLIKHGPIPSLGMGAMTMA
ncbi:MAG TPA: efflux RND transporter periplasmic adaptor subunit, partial [Casimicrobiaceae bacterium]|nr:efflux RND transporter periplasmic adaptor subunit [Casimicrobiaceae bacterium]